MRINATISCFVDRASRYICVIKTILMHCLYSVYFVNQPLHVSCIFVAHHKEAYWIYALIKIGTVKSNTTCGYFIAKDLY